MDCRAFVNHLYEYLDRQLNPEEWESVKGHVTRCRECRRLLESARAELEIALVEAPDDLANSILERTSGLPCGRAREYLPEFIDGNLNAANASLLALHLVYCAGCRVLAKSLREVAEACHGMALVEPDEDFTKAVLQATTKRHPASPSLGARIQAWGRRQIRRPRFALEAAYIGTLLWVLAFGSPASFVRGADSLGPPAIWDKSWVEAARISGSISNTVLDQASSIKSSLHRVREKSDQTLTAVATRGFQTVRDYCSKALHALRATWRRFFK